MSILRTRLFVVVVELEFHRRRHCGGRRHEGRWCRGIGWLHDSHGRRCRPAGGREAFFFVACFNSAVVALTSRPSSSRRAVRGGRRWSLSGRNHGRRLRPTTAPGGERGSQGLEEGQGRPPWPKRWPETPAAVGRFAC
jgi:hypothetical protein